MEYGIKNVFSILIYSNMSQEQQQQLNYYINMLLKVGFGIAAWFAVSTFREMKDDMKTISSDVKLINDRLIRVEDRVENQGTEIKSLEAKIK